MFYKQIYLLTYDYEIMCIKYSANRNVDFLGLGINNFYFQQLFGVINKFLNCLPLQNPKPYFYYKIWQHSGADCIYATGIRTTAAHITYIIYGASTLKNINHFDFTVYQCLLG